MKSLLLIVVLLFSTSCGTFGTNYRQAKADCLINFYDMGIDTDKAIKSCDYVMKRE